MTAQRNRRWMRLILLGVLLITILACGKTAEPEAGQASAGMHGINSDGDEDAGAVAAKALPESDPELVLEAEAEQAPAPQQEKQTGEITIMDCVPKPGEYTLEVADLNPYEDASRRKCNAKIMFTNHTDGELVFVGYRIHNYGGFNYEKWETGAIPVAPGETVEALRFHYCIGGNCGEDGEWYYFDKIVVLYYGRPECSELYNSQEEKFPETIIEIEDPCNFELPE